MDLNYGMMASVVSLLVSERTTTTKGYYVMKQLQKKGNLNYFVEHLNGMIRKDY